MKQFFRKLIISKFNLFWVLYKTAKTKLLSEFFYWGMHERSASKINILVINHFFHGEVESLLKEIKKNDDFECQIVDPEPIFSDALVLFPQSIKEATIPYNDEAMEAIRYKYKYICSGILKKIQKKGKINFILTPSDQFYWIREFLEVAKKNGIKVIVADKEGTISPHSYEVESKRISNLYPPISDYYFVWSQRQQQFWIKAGASERQIKIIGSLRSDLFVNLIPSGNCGKSVLFFDFDSDAYINLVDKNILTNCEFKNWSSMRANIIDSIRVAALKWPDVEFYIKCHPQQVNTKFSNDILKLSNVIIIKGAAKKMDSMFKRCGLVIGFQTTALLEARLSGLNVVYVYWGDLYEKLKQLILPWHDSRFGFEIANSKEQLGSIIDQYLKGQIKYESPAPAIEEYFYKPDGRVASRFLDLLREINNGAV